MFPIFTLSNIPNQKSLLSLRYTACKSPTPYTIDIIYVFPNDHHHRFWFCDYSFLVSWLLMIGCCPLVTVIWLLALGCWLHHHPNYVYELQLWIIEETYKNALHAFNCVLVLLFVQDGLLKILKIQNLAGPSLGVSPQRC